MVLSRYLGMRLSEAEPLLRASETPYTVVLSGPDWKREPVQGTLRIIRVRETEEGPEGALELVCCPVADPFAGEKNV